MLDRTNQGLAKIFIAISEPANCRIDCSQPLLFFQREDLECRKQRARAQARCGCPPPLPLKVVLSSQLATSTCNADSQRMLFARICRHVTLLNRFQKLPTRCSTANIAKKSSATGWYARTIFRATSYHCKLALQVDQCNITFSQAFLRSRPDLSRSSVCGLQLQRKNRGL